jgi:hypothetical protein
MTVTLVFIPAVSLFGLLHGHHAMQGVVVAIGLAALGTVTYRVLTIGLTISPDGLHVRNTFRSATCPWEEIARVTRGSSWRVGALSLICGEVVCIDRRGRRLLPVTATARLGFTGPDRRVAEALRDGAAAQHVAVVA